MWGETNEPHGISGSSDPRIRRSGGVKSAVRAGSRASAGLALVAAVLLAPFAEAQTVSITSTPANGAHYVLGEAITTRIAGLSTAVIAVQGGVFSAGRMSLDIGGVTRQASVTSTFGTPNLTAVDFSYTVTRNDVDPDGVTIPANSISGPIWADAGSNAINRNHSALSNQASHKVIGSAAAIVSTNPSALTSANLDGATLALSLTGTTFLSVEELAGIELETTIRGLTISGVSGAASGGATATLTLSYTGGDRASRGTLAVRIVRDLHAGNLDLITGTVTVAGVAASPSLDSAARTKAVNEAILPELARAMWGSALDAVAGRLASSPGAGGATAAGGGLAATAAAPRANEQALEDGAASWKDLLGGESFAFALGAGGDGATGGQGATVRGTGDWRNLSRDERALDWSGDLFAAHLGVDLAARADLRAGLVGSWFSSDIDYTDRSGRGTSVEGSHESRLTMLSPWLGWRPGGGTRLWGALGFGRGEVELTDEQLRAREGKQSADSRFLAAGVGGASRLWSEGALTLDAKGSLEATRYRVKGNGDAVAGLTVTTRRVRAAAEVARVYALAGGATLTPTFEVGARGDDGDGATGGGLEAGGGLAWADPARGLTLEARGRALLVHRRDLDDWGVSGALRVDPGASGRGLSLRVLPSWGTDGSGVARLWEGDAAAFPDGGGGTRAPAGARLEAEFGYGLPAFSGAGTATPYTGLASVRDGDREVYLGVRLGLGTGLDLDVRASRARARDNRVELRVNARW